MTTGSSGGEEQRRAAEQVLERIAQDEQFRKALLEDPERAIDEAGLKPVVDAARQASAGQHAEGCGAVGKTCSNSCGQNSHTCKNTCWMGLTL